MVSSKGLLGGWFTTPWFDKSLLFLNGNINRVYRLLFERTYRRAKLENHSFRKYSMQTKKAEPNDPAFSLL